MSKQYYLMIEGKRVEVTEEVYRAYKQPLWREARNRRNRFRCRDGKGNRCIRNCLECERYLIGIGAQGFDLSIDDMRVDEMEDRNLVVDELDEILELDRARKIRVAINEMDDSSKRIIIMLTEGYKQKEIAADLGISPSALNQRLTVIRKRLKKYSY